MVLFTFTVHLLSSNWHQHQPITWFFYFCKTVINLNLLVIENDCVLNSLASRMSMTNRKKKMKIHSKKEKHNCTNKSTILQLIFVYWLPNKEYGLIIIPFIICIGSVFWSGSHRMMVKRTVVAALREIIFEFCVDF